MTLIHTCSKPHAFVILITSTLLFDSKNWDDIIVQSSDSHLKAKQHETLAQGLVKNQQVGDN